MVVDASIQQTPEKRKIIGINKLNNFECRDEGVFARHMQPQLSPYQEDIKVSKKLF